METFRNINIQLVPDEETPFNQEIQGKSIFLQSALRFTMDHVVGCAVPELDTSRFGQLWSDVRAKDGMFTFELATTLPYFLPSLDGKAEYCITVNGLELLVCLRMVQAFSGTGFPTSTGMSYVLVHRKALKSLAQNEGVNDLHPIPLRTFISTRFTVHADNAEHAIQEHFFEWRDRLVFAASRLSAALRILAPDEGKQIMPYPAASAFSVFWVVVNDTAGQQFVGETGLAAFRSIGNITAETKGKMDAWLSEGKQPPPHEQALALARMFRHYGYLSFAILQVCVAVETVLATAFTQFVKSRGVSEKRLQDNRKEITYSQLLNVHLFVIRDLSSLDDSRNIIGRLNWARSKRNDVVHEGVSEEHFAPNEVDSAIFAAEKLIAFVKQAESD